MGDQDGRRTPTEKMRALKSMLGEDESEEGRSVRDPNTSLRSLRGLLEVDLAPTSPAARDTGEPGAKHDREAVSPALASPGLGSARRLDDDGEDERRAAERRAARLEREAQAAALRDARKAERAELEAKRAAREEERAARRRAETEARSAEEAAEAQRRAERRAEIEARRAAAEAERLETEQRSREAAERRELERQRRLAEMSADGPDSPTSGVASSVEEPLSSQAAEMHAMEAQWERERQERRDRMVQLEDGEDFGAVDSSNQQLEPTGASDGCDQMILMPAQHDDVVALAVAAEMVEVELEPEWQARAHALEKERQQREELFARRAAEREAQFLQLQEQQEEREAAAREEKRKTAAELARIKREEAQEEAAERAAARLATDTQRQKDWAANMAEKEARRQAAAEQRENSAAATCEQVEVSPRSPVSFGAASPFTTISLARDEPLQDTTTSGFSALEMLRAAQEGQSPQAGQEHPSNDQRTSLGNAPNHALELPSRTLSPAVQREDPSSASRVGSEAVPEETSLLSRHLMDVETVSAEPPADTSESLDSYLATYEAQRQAKRAQWEEERQAAARQHEETLAKAAEERAARRAAMEADRVAMIASIAGASTAEPDALVAPEPDRTTHAGSNSPPALLVPTLVTAGLSQISSLAPLPGSPTSPAMTPRPAADSPPPSYVSYYEDQVDAASPQPDMAAFSPIQTIVQERRRWREPEPEPEPEPASAPEPDPAPEQQAAPAPPLRNLNSHSTASVHSASITGTRRLGGRGTTESLANAQVATPGGSLVDTAVDHSVALQRRLHGAPAAADRDTDETERPPPAPAPSPSLAAWRLANAVSTAEDRYSTTSRSTRRSNHSGLTRRVSVKLSPRDYRGSHIGIQPLTQRSTAAAERWEPKPNLSLASDLLASERSKTPQRTRGASPARRATSPINYYVQSTTTLRVSSPIKYYAPSTATLSPLISATGTLEAILGGRSSTEKASHAGQPLVGASPAPSLTALTARWKSGSSAIGGIGASRSTHLGSASSEIASTRKDLRAEAWGRPPQASRPRTLDGLLSTLGQSRATGDGQHAEAKARRQAEWDALSKSFGAA